MNYMIAFIPARYWRFRGLIRPVILTVLVALSLSVAEAGATVTPRSLLEIEAPGATAMSPAGDRVLVKTRQGDVDDNRYRERYYLLDADGSRAPVRLNLPENANDVRWAPDGETLVFLAPDGEKGRQLWRVTPEQGEQERLTAHSRGIADYALAPTTGAIAYTARPGPAGNENKDEGGRRGVVIDAEWFRAFNINQGRLEIPSRPRMELYVQRPGADAPRPVMTGGAFSAQSLRWSPDGKRLAVTSQPETTLRPLKSDLFVYDMETDRISLLEKGARGGDGGHEGAVAITRPEWGPAGRRLAFLREDHSRRWQSRRDLMVHDFRSGSTRELVSAEDVELSAPRLHWHRDRYMHLELTRRARRGLFTLDTETGRLETVRFTNRYAAGFSFSADGERMAWVEQAVDMPPEVVTADTEAGSAKRISAFNEDLAREWLPNAEPVSWESRDGTKVDGWWIAPRDSSGKRPVPTIVLVSGGPGVTVTNRFRLNPGWFYPVQVFAGRGYGVLVPNYRGKSSFGQDFRDPEALDGEPVEDIITGIDALVEAGRIDPDRLGIAGYSHGSWLAPVTVAESPRFAAASLAEGWGNELSLYGQMPGWLNRNIHDYYMGTNPYADPEPYLERSPIFRESFTATTPTLLEFGEHSGAYQGLEFASALSRQGTDHELVIYPEAGHSLREPQLELDSMERNLEWFERYLGEG